VCYIGVTAVRYLRFNTNVCIWKRDHFSPAIRSCRTIC